MQIRFSTFSWSIAKSLNLVWGCNMTKSENVEGYEYFCLIRGKHTVNMLQCSKIPFQRALENFETLNLITFCQKTKHFLFNLVDLSRFWWNLFQRKDVPNMYHHSKDNIKAQIVSNYFFFYVTIIKLFDEYSIKSVLTVDSKKI